MRKLELHPSVTYFVGLSIPTFFFVWYCQQEQPKIEEDTENSIREKYPHIVEHYKGQRSTMLKTIHDVVEKKVDPDQQAKLDALLRAGKSRGGRLDRNVDPALYGTEAGEKARLEYELQQMQMREEKEKKKALRKLNKKKKKEEAAAAAAAAESEQGMQTVTKSLGVVAAVGLVAAVAVSVLGGRS